MWLFQCARTLFLIYLLNSSVLYLNTSPLEQSRTLTVHALLQIRVQRRLVQAKEYLKTSVHQKPLFLIRILSRKGDNTETCRNVLLCSVENIKEGFFTSLQIFSLGIKAQISGLDWINPKASNMSIEEMWLGYPHERWDKNNRKQAIDQCPYSQVWKKISALILLVLYLKHIFENGSKWHFR